MVFPDGGFEIVHDITGGTINVSTDPMTCIVTLTASDLPIVLADRTGAHVGDGSGTIGVNGHQQLARTGNGSCNKNRVISGKATLNATLTVSFGA